MVGLAHGAITRVTVVIIAYPSLAPRAARAACHVVAHRRITRLPHTRGGRRHGWPPDPRPKQSAGSRTAPCSA